MKWSKDQSETIEKCIKNSYSNPKDTFDSENSLLFEDKNKGPYDSIYLVPAVFLD